MLNKYFYRISNPTIPNKGNISIHLIPTICLALEVIRTGDVALVAALEVPAGFTKVTSPGKGVAMSGGDEMLLAGMTGAGTSDAGVQVGGYGEGSTGVGVDMYGAGTEGQ